MAESRVWSGPTNKVDNFVLLTEHAMYIATLCEGMLQSAPNFALGGGVEYLPDNYRRIALEDVMKVCSVERGSSVGITSGTGLSSSTTAISLSSSDDRDSFLLTLSGRLGWPIVRHRPSPHKAAFPGAGLAFVASVSGWEAYRAATATRPLAPTSGRGACYTDTARWIGRTIGPTLVIIIFTALVLLGLFLFLKPYVRPRIELTMTPGMG